jgi:hypothetical protein
VPGKGWFTRFRFDGPLEPFFDKTWKPDDIIEANSRRPVQLPEVRQ